MVLDTFMISSIWLFECCSCCTISVWGKKCGFCRKLLHLLQRPANHSEQAGGGSRRDNWVWLTPRGATLHLLYQITCSRLHLIFCSPAVSLPTADYKISADSLATVPQATVKQWTLSPLSPVSSSICLGKPSVQKCNKAMEIFHLEGGRGGSTLFFSLALRGVSIGVFSIQPI